MAYGTAIWHQSTKPASKPKGLAAKLRIEQNQGLQTVLGAFRATPVRQLETELYVLLLDI
jgi:hypothetical protein